MHVVVIGGGHAGIEAAHAAAKMGAAVTMITINLDQIGQMSCNPSIGGVGKGHIVREIDALGGLMGRLADAAGIHFRILNESRGFAVRGPRAQADRVRYRLEARKWLEQTSGVFLKQGMVASLLLGSGQRVRGVGLSDGSQVPCDAVVLATGTFLGGQILIGDKRIEAGRAGEPASNSIPAQLKSLGLPLRRFKTGTSPRIDARTIDFGAMQPQPGDPCPRQFSFFGPRPPLPQVPCHIVFTTMETERIVRENLHRSSMYGGHVEGVGPRYCPSIEDKYVKFPEKERHQIFVEPDSLETKEIYLSGLSTSMPVDVQLQMVRTLCGFGQAEIMRPGYAIEYDALDPLQLDLGMAVRGVEGLWAAGQINGTTGYEEAAGQGFIAGVNAVRFLRGEPPIIIGRGEAYLGVMIDDIVTKGADEPYRMLTARAERRLELAADLADTRLLEKAKEIGVLSQGDIAAAEKRAEWRSALVGACRSEWAKKTSEYAKFAYQSGLELSSGMTVADLLKRQQIGQQQIDGILREACRSSNISLEGVNWEHEKEAILFFVRYSGYREREAKLADQASQWDAVAIPDGFLVGDVPGLSIEVREKLKKHRPQTLGQASRVPGITHAAVALLHMLIEKSR
ncbi:MAG: tRNA uridine-5-carboxymethylaminomethyl(34) synthesis enzyme MnmG [Holophagales bacterium]|jgi:tRNA uridine 5-carboxymethylaminomethyl modification enzyme|nr:tRNA uridine-5-carboxymethylaminomethyl(34) synthesis enzyme MnmG [Holophagales bacterium]